MKKKSQPYTKNNESWKQTLRINKTEENQRTGATQQADKWRLTKS